MERWKQDLDRWLTTEPEWGTKRMKTVGEFIKELQDLAEEHGEDLPVLSTEETVTDVGAEFYEDDEEGPSILIG